MNKFYTIITTTLLILALSACSETDPMDKPDTEKEELAINAGVVTTVVTSRADDPDFTENFDLFMNQTAPTTPDLTNHTKYDAVYDTGFTVYEAGSNTNIWYWDDNGGHSAVVDLLGIYPKGTNATPTNLTTGFTKSVVANQSSTVNVTASDLLISNRVAGYTLAKQKVEATKANLKFKHVFSKLTFELIKGVGFQDDGSDFDPSIETVELHPDATVSLSFDVNDAANDVVNLTPSGTKAAITPFLVTDESDKKVLEAIAIPNQTILKGEKFASITITLNGVSNSYDVKLPNETGDTDITFGSGINHVFKITVNKTDADVSVSLLPWVTDPSPVVREVNIGVETGISLDNAGVKDDASLYFKITKGTELTALRRSSVCTVTGADPDWVRTWGDLNPGKLYWDDVPNGSTAKAILINTDATNPEDIYEGSTTISSNKANESLNFANMTHPFSRVNIKIRTEQGAADKVELDKLTNIKFNTNIVRFDNINVDIADNANFQTITYKTNANSAVTPVKGTLETETEGTTPIITYEYYKQLPIYIKPVTIAKDAELLNITYVNESVTNQYPLKLNLASNLVFEANKDYTIVVTLNKTEIAKVGVSIKSWVIVNDHIGGGATIEE